MASEETTSTRNPELILASEADRRVSTANGGRGSATHSLSTNQMTADALSSVNKNNGQCQTPDNTPRHPGALPTKADSGTVEQEVNSEWAELGEVLDTDEMFMALTDEERKEWDTMMKERSQFLESAKGQHRLWADSFTRRRMFVYSRMRKLQQSYAKRIQCFAKMTESFRKLSNSRTVTSASLNVAGKGTQQLDNHQQGFTSLQSGADAVSQNKVVDNQVAPDVATPASSFDKNNNRSGMDSSSQLSPMTPASEKKSIANSQPNTKELPTKSHDVYKEPSLIDNDLERSSYLKVEQIDKIQ